MRDDRGDFGIRIPCLPDCFFAYLPWQREPCQGTPCLAPAAMGQCVRCCTTTILAADGIRTRLTRRSKIDCLRLPLASATCPPAYMTGPANDLCGTAILWGLALRLPALWQPVPWETFFQGDRFGRWSPVLIGPESTWITPRSPARCSCANASVAGVAVYST